MEMNEMTDQERKKELEERCKKIRKKAKQRGGH